MAKLSFESFFFVGGPTFYPRSGLLLGYPRILRGSLKFEKHSSKMFCEEFVLRRLVASPLIKLRFTPGGAGGEMRAIGRFPSACSGS